MLATGAQVKHVKEGDRVMTTWLPRDLANADHTPERTWYTLPDGTVATTGRAFMFTFADNVIADEQYVVPLPDDVPTDVTAIIGCPVMTGAGAVRNTAGVQAGQSVAIFGVGGVGLAAIAAAAVIGAAPIIAVDVAEEKLAFAKRFGATIGVNAAAGDPVERDPRPHGRRRGLRLRLHRRHCDRATDAGRDQVRGLGRRPRRHRPSWLASRWSLWTWKWGKFSSVSGRTSARWAAPASRTATSHCSSSGSETATWTSRPS